MFIIKSKKARPLTIMLNGRKSVVLEAYGESEPLADNLKSPHLKDCVAGNLCDVRQVPEPEKQETPLVTGKTIRHSKEGTTKQRRSRRNRNTFSKETQ